MDTTLNCQLPFNFTKQRQKPFQQYLLTGGRVHDHTWQQCKILYTTSKIRRRRTNINPTWYGRTCKLKTQVNNKAHSQACSSFIVVSSHLHTEIPHQSCNEAPPISLPWFLSYLTHWTSRAGVLLHFCVITYRGPAFRIQTFRQH